VRQDISLAAQLVQVGHACLEAGQRFEQPAQPCHLVLCGVSSEEQLARVVEQLEQQEVRVFLFYEPDFPRGYTAACTEPVCGERRRIFRRFRLWREG